LVITVVPPLLLSQAHQSADQMVKQGQLTLSHPSLVRAA